MSEYPRGHASDNSKLSLSADPMRASPLIKKKSRERRAALSYKLLEPFAKDYPAKPWRLVLSLLKFSLLVFTPSLIAASLDKCLFLVDGAGLLEHLAFWGLFLGNMLTVYLLLKTCHIAEKVVEKYCSPDSQVPHCRRRVMQWLRCSGRGPRMLLAFMMLCGAGALALNISNTLNIVTVYQHDSWDSALHPRSFVVAKILLAFEWIYLFPVTVYLGLATGISVFHIATNLAQSRELDLSLFEPDRCGGYRLLGEAMLCVVSLNIPFALVVAGNIATHRLVYHTLVAQIALLAIIIGLQLFAPFSVLHKFLSRAKQMKLKELADLIGRDERRLRSKESPPATLENCLRVLSVSSLYSEAERLRTWPYIPSDGLRWLTPFLPLIASLAKQL